jgi:flagellar motor protein MotB
MQVLIYSLDWAFEWWKKWVAELEKRIALLTKKIAELETKIALLSQRNPLEDYLARSAAARMKVLVELKSLLKRDFPKLMIEISAESDALRFQGEGLFRTGESQLMDDKRAVVAAIARRLDQLLPDYTFDKAGHARWDATRNPDFALIEAVQIEGHTDSEGDDMSNLHLSTARANATFVAMLAAAGRLTAYMNYKKQPVLSVAGYGEMRPVASNDTASGRATNRRIDLRIIMHTPASIADVDVIKKRLKGGRGLE